VTILPTGTVASNNPAEPIWFRPWYSDADTLCRVLDHVLAQPPVNGVHRPLMMMFHNVELLAGASPYPQTAAEVQRYLDMMARVFELAERRGVKACTMAEYADLYAARTGAAAPRTTAAPAPIEVNTRAAAPTVDLDPAIRIPSAVVEKAIADHGDCWYGDGVQVGAYARFHLAMHYLREGKRAKAEDLIAEIRKEIATMIEGGVTAAEIDGCARERLAAWNNIFLDPTSVTATWAGLLDDESTAAAWRERTASLLAVQPQATQAAAARWLSASTPHQWVVVGDRKTIEAELAETGLTTRWITADEAVLGTFERKPTK
jgi:hypothetical protein